MDLSLQNLRLFFLKTKNELPAHYQEFAKQLLMCKIDVIPINLQALFDIMPKERKLFVFSSVLNTTQKKNWENQIVPKLFRPGIYSQLTLFHLSSFDINELIRLRLKKFDFHLYRTPIDGYLLSKKIAHTILEQELENNSWPGGIGNPPLRQVFNTN